MNIDPKLLSAIKDMDPSELSDKIDVISRAMGIDARYIKNMLGSPEDIEKKLTDLSDRDIKRISEKIDPELLKRLNSGEI